MNKRILSLLLALVLVLGSSLAFAADYDIKNKTTLAVEELADVLFDSDLFFEIAFDQENYLIESGTKFYNLKDVQAKFAVDPTLTLAQAVVGLTPVTDPVPGELTVKSAKGINPTTVLVVMSDDTVREGKLTASQTLKLNIINEDVLFIVDGEYYVADVLYTVLSSDWEKDIEKYYKDFNPAMDRANLATKNLAAATKDATWADRYGTDQQKVEALRVLGIATVEEAAALADLALVTANAGAAIYQSYTAIQYEKADELVKIAENIPHTRLAAKQVALDNAEDYVESLLDDSIGGGNLSDYDDMEEILESLLNPGDHKIPEWRLAWDDGDGRYIDLTNRLDNVEAIIEATERVEQVEEALENGTIVQGNIDWAAGAVDGLEDEDVKTALEQRLEVVQEAFDLIVKEYLEQQATKAVENSETRLDELNYALALANHDTAKPLVEALEDEVVKAALLARLKEVENSILAESKVKDAEYRITISDFENALIFHDEALLLVNALEEGPVRVALLARLKAVEDAIVEDLDIAAAGKVDVKIFEIGAIPTTINPTFMSKTTAAKVAFDALTPAQKLLVDAGRKAELNAAVAFVLTQTGVVL